MRAVIHHEFGNPEQVLAVEDVETPEPAAGEVRVRMVLAAIHNHDLMTVRGEYGFLPELPARTGTEGVGVVDALGEGVTGLELGQRVVTGTPGTWAEYVTIPARAVVPVADAIPDEAAAQLIAMPFSALSLLDYLGVERGDWILQNAANGAVGRLLARLAVTRGVNVVGLVRRADAVDQLAQEGIGNVVATDAEDWRERVTDITGGAPIRAGVDSVGGAPAGEVLSLVGDGGTLVVFGAMASPTLELAVHDILFRQITVKGYWGAKSGSYFSAERRGELMAELQERIADGTVDLPTASVHALDDVADAVRASDQPGRVGKVLLRP
jgi:NADPH2:quinone reductase